MPERGAEDSGEEESEDEEEEEPRERAECAGSAGDPAPNAHVGRSRFVLS